MRPGRSRPTQEDVARKAGVSQATVSYVLTGRGDSLNKSTRRRVEAALEELGYLPNMAARVLRGAPTALLGVLVRSFDDPSLAVVIEALTHAARARGYEVLVSTTDASAPSTLSLAGLMKDQLCDGVVLVGDVPDEYLLWDSYGDVGLPAVGVFQGSRDLPIPNVTVDNQAGATLALEHLVGLGHRRIAFASGGWIHGSRERLETFEEHRAGASLSIEDRPVVAVENRPEGGAAALEQLRALAEPPTAVFAATDQLAMGILARAFELGVRVPGELSVVGFDDAPQARFLAPALTTVRQPFEAISEKAIDILLDGVAGAVLGSARHPMAPQLLIRSSTAPPLARSSRAQVATSQRGSSSIRRHAAKAPTTQHRDHEQADQEGTGR